MKWEEKRGEKEGTGRERTVLGFQTAQERGDEEESKKGNKE